jgi:aminoglycoside/choline kinase family phosphotransferase
VLPDGVVAALPEDVRATVERSAGSIRAIEDRSWPHGVTRVWRVHAAEIVWVKQHTQERKFRQESRAYNHVVPALAAAGHRVPDRIAEDRELHVLVLTEVAGRPAPERDVAVHAQAGEFTEALHAIPLVDGDTMSVSDVIAARLTEWSAESRGLVDDATLARASAELSDPTVFADGRRTWCHRDWSPRNWLVDDTGRFGALDFEHCGPDLWLVDFLKLADGVWRGFPETRDAFFEGYGRRLDASDRDRVRRLMWLSALRSTSWAAEHGDPAYERHGRAVLAALAAGWEPFD